jgi:hypothetical protein
MTITRCKPCRQRPWARFLAVCIALLIVGAALAGCSVGEEASAVLSPTATRTPQATFTPAPSETAAPTETPTQVPATPIPFHTPTPTPTRNPNISPLTGLEADPDLLTRRVLAIRVGNDPSIRPQEGLSAADIVYEEVMDGWSVTRFTALYLESDASRVRPLRSARLSNLTLVPQYDAALVHTGASDPIRWLISQATFVDLDQFFHPAPYRLLAGYDWRGRIYTTTDAVHAYLESTGRQQDRLIEGYEFDPTPPRGEPAPEVRIPYPSSSAVRWEYDPTTGRYLRYVQGRAHTDALTNEQIAADNVIIFYAEHRATNIVEDTLGATAIDIVMTGSGRAVVIRDGVRVEGRWRRIAEDRPILYWDENMNIIPLRPGKTWIQLVPPDYQIIYE